MTLPSVESSLPVIAPLQCNEAAYYQGNNPTSGTLALNNGITALLETGILYTGELRQWREKFYQSHLQGRHVIVVDNNFPVNRIDEYERASIYAEGTLKEGVLTIPAGIPANHTIEGWGKDIHNNIIQCPVPEIPDPPSGGIRVQTHLQETITEDRTYYVVPKTLRGIPKDTPLKQVSIQASNHNSNLYDIEAVYLHSNGKEKRVTFQATSNAPEEKPTFWEQATLQWGKLWRQKTTYPETMPSLPPELTTVMSQVPDENWRHVRDTELEWDDKWLLFDEDEIDQFDYKKVKTTDRDGNKIKTSVTGTTEAQTTWVEYTDAEGQARKVKVIKENTTITYKSREDNSLIKTFVREIITVKEKGQLLYVDTKKTTTYPPSADGSVPEKVEEERSFEDHTQQIETRQRTEDNGTPYQIQYWLGTIDLSVGAGVMGGLPTLRFYDEEAPGNLLAVGALVGGEVRTPWYYMMAVDLAIGGQQESYASETGSTELKASWAPTLRPYWTFVGYSSQRSQDDIKNNWSLGITIPQTYHLSSWARPASMDGHLTYGSTSFRVRNPERPIWMANGIGLRGRWFPGDQQKHSVIMFLTAEESRGTIYGNYDDLVIETSDGPITNPATATTAYSWGPVLAAYYTYSF